MKLGDKGVNSDPIRNGGIREQLEPTTRAVVAADEVHIWESIADAEMDRRGPLQKLTRRDGAQGLWRHALSTPRTGRAVPHP